MYPFLDEINKWKRHGCVHSLVMLFYNKPLKYIHAVFRFDHFINECCIFLSMYDRNSNETANNFTRIFIKYLKNRVYNYIRSIYSSICFLFPIIINKVFIFSSIVLHCFRYVFKYSFTLFSQQGLGTTSNLVLKSIRDWILTTQ